MSGSAFYAAITGLQANQSRLNVIANNVANINTYGFKSSRVTFSDLLNQTLACASSPQGSRGGVNPMQVGLGVKLASIDTIMTQGSIQNTGNTRDLAIDGDGFFIVAGEGGNRFTRTGNFSMDFNGTLLTVDGLRVQGYSTLEDDGLNIDTNNAIGDIVINFGEKIPARATEEVRFRSNLDAGSHIFGTAELTSPGSTGFTLAAGTMLPIAKFEGITVNDGSAPPLDDSTAGNNDLVINGQEITITWPVGWTWGDSATNAQFIADAINSQSTTVFASVGNSDNLIIHSMTGGEESDVIIAGDSTTPGFLATIGLTAGTTSAPEPSGTLAGQHKITVTEATQAAGTTSTPVQAGALVSDTFYINDYAITYVATDVENTSAQNAQVIVDAINDTAGLNLTATANANGTITLISDFAGESNIIAVENEGTALGVTGLDTLGLLMDNPFPIGPGTALDAYVVNNGTDATVSNTFTSDDETETWTRMYTNSTPYGTESTLDSLMDFILGDNPALTLIPGVTLTADELTSGEAVITTHDAFEHSTSINVYDTLGNAHFLAVTYKHVGENLWEWTADLPEEPNLAISNGEGEVRFDTNGMVATPNPSESIIFSPAGAQDVSVDLIFNGMGNTLDGITQFGSDTTTRAEYQDGYSTGILQTVAFGPNGNGILYGSFSNGQVRPMAQIALANFNNPEGLERTGNNAFNATANSGLPIISVALQGGAGGIIPGALEQSNVDLSTEFTNMIVSQRGFQANSRVITTQDALMAEAVNLVR
ncbi:flagellar hook-basal body complex protein [bacterium]|nr:flagellar hook-basal body complex protein [bacterium]